MDWFFLGTSFDDTVAIGPTEGMFCDRQGRIGFYQISNGQMGNKLNRYDFNEMECVFDGTTYELSVDRYIPNLWIKNAEITYYISSGMGNLDLISKPPVPVTIKSGDNNDRLIKLTTSGASKAVISFTFLSTIVSLLLII